MNNFGEINKVFPMENIEINEIIENDLMDINNNIDNDEMATSKQNISDISIKVYKIRWFILIVIVLANISNNINWIMFSPIADYTGQFYSVDYDSVNYLSLIFLIVSIPIGFISFWLIDNFGIRISIILGSWINLIGALIRILTAIDKSDGKPIIPQQTKYSILMLGQVVCSLAQTFLMFVSTKFANNWFGENQRALANTFCLIANTIGILIGTIYSSQVVSNTDFLISPMFTIHLVAIIISFLPAFLSCFIFRSNPPTPPSYSQILINKRNNSTGKSNERKKLKENLIIFKDYFYLCSRLFKSKCFLILLFSFGLALGIFNALVTLIQQFLCVRGYTNADVGYFSAALIIAGLIGCVIDGIILDKTKRFEEIAKICFIFAFLADIFLIVVQLFNKNTVNFVLFIISFSIFGFFGLPLLPVCMEKAVECVYPIPEATSTGLLFIAGQIVGIILIVVFPKVSKSIDQNSDTYKLIQTCTTESNTTSDSSLTAVDYRNPLYAQMALLGLTTFLFVLFFKCPYLRVNSEKKNENENNEPIDEF